MWQHNYEPVGGSLALSAIVAAIPIVVLFLLLGVLRKPAWMAASSALGSALIVALAAYGMPVQLALTSAVFGAAWHIPHGDHLPHPPFCCTGWRSMHGA